MSAISFIFIFIVHYLLVFFKATLTVPKIKDLVNCPTQKYQDIYNTIINTSPIENTTDIDLLPVGECDDTLTNESMKNELKSFLKKQMQKDDVYGLDSSESAFSAY